MHRLLRLMLLFFVLVACGMQSTVPANADEGRLFPVTGFRVRGEFLNYWETNGGLPVFGYPVSAELWEDGRVVQYFERNRFELHPDKTAPFNVLLGLLGIERLQASGRDWRTQQQGKASDGCLFFAETNHSLCGEFRQYWEKHGGLAIFGYPITEPAQEVSETDGNTYTVQYLNAIALNSIPKTNHHITSCWACLDRGALVGCSTKLVNHTLLAPVLLA